MLIKLANCKSVIRDEDEEEEKNVVGNIAHTDFTNDTIITYWKRGNTANSNYIITSNFNGKKI